MNAFIKELMYKIKHLPNTVSDYIYDKYPYLFIDKRVSDFIDTKFDLKNHNGRVFRDDFEENCRTFIEADKLSDTAFMSALRKDIVKNYIQWGITPDEYFMHDFQNKSEEYKSTILSRKRKDDLCCHYLGRYTREYFGQLKDKYVFYTLAKPFFKRDVCKLETDNDFDTVSMFCSKHPVFIAKPRKASSGIGVHIVTMADYNNDPKIVFEKYKNMDDGNWMFEEKIAQDQRMAQWHPSSVNTIRVPSIRNKKGVTVLLPLFRTGKNGNLVDNCHNDGGLMAVPDETTGILVSDGYDVFNHVVISHPNSQMVFKGWQVPAWQELIETAKTLHESLPPKHKYVGFDFALTDKGWVVVEGNWGNFPHQVCVNRGIRREFEKLMKN